MHNPDWTPTPDQIEAAHRYGAGPGGYVARSAGCTCRAAYDMDRDRPMHGMGDLTGDLRGGRVRRALRRAKRRALAALKPNGAEEAEQS